MSEHDPSRALDDQVAGCAAAHQRLMAVLDAAVDTNAVDPLAPSLLPGWTIGHVLTHLARNADGFRNMIEGAALGEVRSMYVSQEARDGDIEAGAARPLDALLNDVRTSAWALESSWARLSNDAWNGQGLTRTGPTPIKGLPWRRWREVEVHQADMGLAFGPADWSPEFVSAGLTERLDEWSAAEGTDTPLPEEVSAAEPWQQLAWLLGRPAGLTTPGVRWA